MTKEKAGCGYCSRTGHTWGDGAGKLICFECMRQQRLDYHTWTKLLADQVADLQGRLNNQATRPLPPDLWSDLQELHEITSRLLAAQAAPKGKEDDETASARRE